MALNAGPVFKFNEAISFFVGVDTQAEIDELWDKLIAGGGSPSQCGWLKDKYGLSWQIVPNTLGEMLSDPDPAKSGRCMNAMLQMSKLDVGEAARGVQRRVALLAAGFFFAAAFFTAAGFFCRHRLLRGLHGLPRLLRRGRLACRLRRRLFRGLRLRLLARPARFCRQRVRQLVGFAQPLGESALPPRRDASRRWCGPTFTFDVCSDALHLRRPHRPSEEDEDFEILPLRAHEEVARLPREHDRAV